MASCGSLNAGCCQRRGPGPAQTLARPLPPPGFPWLQFYLPWIPGLPSGYPYCPDAFGMLHEDVWLTTADGVRLHGWLMWQPHSGGLDVRRSRPTVVYFNESVGNMAFRCGRCIDWSA